MKLIFIGFGKFTMHDGAERFLNTHEIIDVPANKKSFYPKNLFLDAKIHNLLQQKKGSSFKIEVKK